MFFTKSFHKVFFTAIALSLAAFAFAQTTNLASGKTANQSTTEGDFSADKGVDNDAESRSETKWSSAPWWQVDLGNRYSISQINLVPAWENHLDDFILIFSDTDFPNAEFDRETAILEQCAVKAIRVNEGNKWSYTVPVNPAVSARYVRIQRKAGTVPLGLKNAAIIGDSNPATGNPPSKKSWSELLDAGTPYDAARDRQSYYERGYSGALAPELMSVAVSDGVAIGWQDKKTGKLKVSRYQQSGGNFTKLWSKELPDALDFLAGVASDGSNCYIMTAKSENLNDDKTTKAYRNGILRLVTLNSNGDKTNMFELNQEKFTNERVYNPITPSGAFWGTSRLTYGNGMFGYILGKSQDVAGDNIRHQNAMRRIMKTDGTPLVTKGGYHGHSMEHRIIYDGTDFITLDRQEWGVLMTKVKPSEAEIPGQAVRPVYTHLLQGQYPKIWLGNVAKGDDGYVVTFATEREQHISNHYDRPHDMAMVHVVSNFDQIAPKDDFPASDMNIIVRNTVVDTKSKNSNATDEQDLPEQNGQAGRKRKTAGIAWLTSYPAGSGGTFRTGERNKMVQFNSSTYVLIWEEWQVNNNQLGNYITTKAIVIDEYGNVKKAEKDLGQYRLNIEDDCMLYQAKAAWVIGDPQNLRFRLFTLDENLNLTEYDLGL